MKSAPPTQPSTPTVSPRKISERIAAHKGCDAYTTCARAGPTACCPLTWSTDANAFTKTPLQIAAAATGHKSPSNASSCGPTEDHAATAATTESPACAVIFVVISVNGATRDPCSKSRRS